MIFTLTGKMELLTINKAFATLRNGRRVRSKAYAVFKRNIAILMSLKQREYALFERSFDPTKHELHATLNRGTPCMYTKKGCISKNSGDTANYEKTLCDSVMTGIIDDAFITKWEITKYESDEHEFLLSLEIKER